MELKKIISGLTVLTVLLGLLYSLPAKANPATLAGAAATVNIGEIKAINTLTVTEAIVGEIALGNDLRIRIPAAVTAEWDIADTTAVIVVAPPGDIVVSNTVSYEGNNDVLVVDVTADSTIASTFTIDGLSYIGVTGISGPTLLEFSIDGGTVYNNAQAGTTLEVTDGAEDTLTNITAVPTNPASGVTTNYTVNFTLPQNSVIPRAGLIVVDLPNDFDTTGVVWGAQTGMDGNFAVVGAPNGVATITRQNDGTNTVGGAGGTAIQIVLNTIINSPVAANNKVLSVTTQTSIPNQLATGNSANFTVNPNPIANLACVPSGMPGAIWLTWNVPQLNPTGYVVRYSLGNITNDAQFGAATLYNQAWAAGAAGAAKQELVMNLNPNVIYFFNVKVTGAGNALSLISNTGTNCVAPAQAAPSDETAPTSSITDPQSGATILAGQNYTVKGTSSDSGGSSVKKVSVSLDGGTTWYEVSAGQSNQNSGFDWTYVWQSPVVGTYTLKTKAEDWYGNVETPGTGITVKVATELPAETPEQPPSAPPEEKPISQMTAAELQAKIVQIQQQIISLLQQLIQKIQEQINRLLGL